VRDKKLFLKFGFGKNFLSREELRRAEEERRDREQEEIRIR
jgi:hypothetical protein